MHIMMSTFKDFSLPEMYEAIRSKDTLPEIDCSIDWESMRPMIRSLFHNNTEKGGRPNFDEIVMIKALFLQGLYSIVDEKLEKELYDRILFHNFLHYCKRHNGSCIQKHSPDHGTGPQESQDLKEADTRRAAIFSDPESTEWWSHPYHHGEKGEGEDDICQYGIQSIHGGSPEEKGDDSVSARK